MNLKFNKSLEDKVDEISKKVKQSDNEFQKERTEKTKGQKFSNK